MTCYRTEFPVGRMAVVLGVSRSGYYAWLRRKEHRRAAAQERFDVEVRASFERSKRRYGRIRIMKALQERGIGCSVNRVARSMRRQRLRSRRSRTFMVTTNARHDHPVAANLLSRDFTAREPNQTWVSDITYLPCRQGWLYLAVFIDLYSRRVVGWCVSHSLKHETVMTAFTRATRERGPVRGLIVHSDRGVQYCCTEFRSLMATHGVIQSMSRKGDCWDNAVSESFFATLKRELPMEEPFETLVDAERSLFEYFEIDYNRYRLHSTLGYTTPVTYEERYWATRCAQRQSA